MPDRFSPFISDQNARKKGQFLHCPVENRRKRGGEKTSGASSRIGSSSASIVPGGSFWQNEAASATERR